MARRKALAILGWFVLALSAAAGVGYLLAQTQALPKGPRKVIWDKESCAHCGMAVSDRRFAAQLQTRDGEVLDFDDPGCLLAYLHQRRPEVHAAYFRALTGKGWIPMAGAAFVRVGQSPMGFGLGAVPKGTPGGLTCREAESLVLAKTGTGGG